MSHTMRTLQKISSANYTVLYPIMTPAYKWSTLESEEIRIFYAGMSCRTDELHSRVLWRTNAPSRKVADSIPGGDIVNFH